MSEKEKASIWIRIPVVLCVYTTLAIFIGLIWSYALPIIEIMIAHQFSLNGYDDFPIRYLTIISILASFLLAGILFIQIKIMFNIGYAINDKVKELSLTLFKNEIAKYEGKNNSELSTEEKLKLTGISSIRFHISILPYIIIMALTNVFLQVRIFDPFLAIYYITFFISLILIAKPMFFIPNVENLRNTEKEEVFK